jgi:hypothetical protein
MFPAVHSSYMNITFSADQQTVDDKMAPGEGLVTRRESIAALAAGLASAASRFPVNRHVKWGLGSNLWNYFPRVRFTEILDVVKDTGFIGLRLTQFIQILKTYDITAAECRGKPRSADARS